MNRGTCDNDEDDDDDDGGGGGVGRVMLVVVVEVVMGRVGLIGQGRMGMGRQIVSVDVVVVMESLSARCVIELLMFPELLVLLWGTPQGLVTPARV